MGGDYTRRRFNPLNDASGILSQQGRVMLDQDMNELVDILDRRLRAETVDIIGRAVVPTFTPDGFKIRTTTTAAGQNDLTIGAGRIYVDGLLAENHGTTPQFDTVLEETPGTQPLPFEQQPYMPTAWPFPAAVPNPFVLPTDGQPFLVYLDVWKREVTYLEAPDLIDQAVAVDTATRTQTAWQVKVLPDVPPGTTCSTPDNQINNWTTITRRSAGQLTTSAAGVPSSTDPCIIPPNTGYRGTDNRTYRVEIHTPGPLGTAQFKYSRNNASVASPITAINGSVLTVVRTKRDSVLRFSLNDWIEVTDDIHELAGQPGTMCQILSVDDTALTITLQAATPLPPGVYDATQPQRHTRVILWDQHGRVFDTNGNLISNVDSNGGLINVPANATVVLEDGVQVAFSLDPLVTAGAQFLVGDYWLFVARVVDSSVEQLTNAPPRGIHHHYCRLAVITFPNSVQSCLTYWPPDFGGDCECTACVTADSHNQGTFTIQMAIDQVLSTGGKVCLGPGTYNLQSTINISGANFGIEISGKGAGPLVQAGLGVTTLVAPAPVKEVSNPAILIESSTGITIQDLELNFAPGTIFAFDPAGTGIPIPNPGIMIQNSQCVTVQRCTLVCNGNQVSIDPAVAVGGFVFQTVIRENVIQFNSQDASGNPILGPGTGVTRLPLYADVQYNFAMVADLYIRDNLMQCGTSGVNLDANVLYMAQLGITSNLVLGSTVAGIEVDAGFVGPEARIDISDNEIVGTGIGISCGLSARIENNDLILSPVYGPDPLSAFYGGIIITQPSVDSTNDGTLIVGNRISGAGGWGILSMASLGSAVISDNLMENVASGGIVVTSAQHLRVANNQLLGLVPNTSDPFVQLFGAYAISVYAQEGYIEIEGNIIKDFAVDTGSVSRVGITASVGNLIRIADNQLINIGPANSVVNTVFGIRAALVGRADITGNVVRRKDTGSEEQNSPWWGVFMWDGKTTQAVGRVAEQPPGILDQVVQTGDNQFVLVSAVGITQVNTTRLPKACVRGNFLDVSGSSPAAQIDIAGECIFTDNECMLITANQANPTVEITANAVVAGNNVLGGGNQDSTALALTVLSKTGFTVLGNVATGGIRVNGAALGAPWNTLNVI